MFIIIGAAIVFVSIIVGYLMHHGQLAVLLQYNEFIIIGGAAVGSMIIGNSLSVIKKIIAGVLGTLKGPKVSKKAYIELLKLLYELFQFAKREGLIALEPHVEKPESSTI
ncbi:MAG: chemotaxis protein MotA, partial [Bacteroidota bacterium]|nr:chemotaxis protein MotA [Bacteroidota bacterium]